MDRLDREARSRLMAAVKSRDTGPELLVRSTIHRLGYRFRLHCTDLPGKPDIVLPRLGKIVMVHGCFWHRHARCKLATMPKTRAKFWAEKFRGNVERDLRTRRHLRALGWRVLVVWQCETRRPEKLEVRIARFLDDE